MAQLVYNPDASSKEDTVSDTRAADTSSLQNGGQRRQYPRLVKIWLITGLVMIFVQVVVGGITRLTGSGLSITRWEIVTGTLPPMQEADWQQEFELYQATPQYEKLNEGMSMADFKFIYFWEYIHRLWARFMGFVFLLPLLWFSFKGYIDKPLAKRLGLVFASAALTASFGWIMVASGLISRPFVDAYKLSMHLGIAFVTFGILLWTTLWVMDGRLSAKPSGFQKRWVYGLFAVLVLQILLGGMMSGMKAALAYPSWPDMQGAALPGVLFEAGSWTWSHVVHYDSHPFMSALVQALHRFTGYVVALGTLAAAVMAWRDQTVSAAWKNTMTLMLALVFVQVLLGVITLITSVSEIPVLWGVLHQGAALILLSVALAAIWLLKAPAGLMRSV